MLSRGASCRIIGATAGFIFVQQGFLGSGGEDAARHGAGLLAPYLRENTSVPPKNTPAREDEQDQLASKQQLPLGAAGEGGNRAMAARTAALSAPSALALAVALALALALALAAALALAFHADVYSVGKKDHCFLVRK